MEDKTIVIIPSCSDLNRGDQALVWETKRVAEDCGYKGKFYFQTEKNEPIQQSLKKGLNPIYPILEHPSRKFKNKKNINYNMLLKMKWGLVSIIDLITSLMFLYKPTRNIIWRTFDDNKKHTYEIFKKADAVFVKGGGLLQTYGGLSSTYSMYFWTYPIFLAHVLNKPVYIMPNSFGPFNGPFVKSIAKSALKKCKLVTSREKRSQKMVKEQLNLQIENYADLAFNLTKSKISKNMVLNKYDIPKDRKLVALTMRPYRFPKSDDPNEAYDKFKSEMAKFIHWLYLQGYMPVMVEHTLAINAHENDGACIKDVASRLDKKEYRIISNKSFDCCDLKEIYSFFDYIIGTRFHSLIFSFGSDVPGIAIAYVGNKSQGIMEDMGLGNYVVDIYNVTCTTLCKEFSNLVKNENIVKQKISKYLTSAKKDRNKIISRIKQIDN